MADEGISIENIVGIGCGAPDGNYYSGCIEYATDLAAKCG